MICSMTAFAAAESDIEDFVLSWELRSVNHRYLDISIRFPKTLRMLEADVRSRVGAVLKRGKVECTLIYTKKEGHNVPPAIDLGRVKQLLIAVGQIEVLMDKPASLSALDILAWPEVMQEDTIDSDSLTPAVLALLDTTLKQLLAAREREGIQLKGFISARCELISAQLTLVRERYPLVLKAMREKIHSNLLEMEVRVDSERVEQEMVYMMQKLDVDEELDRLLAHIDEVNHILEQNEPVGRRLDFLMQEMNREANTLGSKSADTETTRAAVELKVLIEQMREQVQNIE